MPTLLATLPSLSRRTRAVVAVVAVAALVLSVILAVGAVAGIRGLADGADTAVVERVVGGDTLEVTLRGESERVRLLNVDAPGSDDPTREAECFEAEAAEFLRDLLPAGTEVTLEYDDLRVDRYGRVMAALFLGDTLVNAELARHGLGAPVIVSGNTRYLGKVRAASDEAASAQAGLFSGTVDCTASGQVASVETAIRGLPTLPADATATALAAAAGTAAVTVAMGSVVEASATDGTGIHWSVLGMERKAALLDRLAGAIASGHATVADLRARAGVQAAVEAEAARIAAEAAAAEAAAAEAARAADAAKAAAASKTVARPGGVWVDAPPIDSSTLPPVAIHPPLFVIPPAPAD